MWRTAVRFRRQPGLNRNRPSPGFTLIEILLAIALLGLIAFLFIGGASDLFRAQEKSVQDVFWQSVQSARLQAVQEDRTVVLRYDEKLHQLSWGVDGSGSSLDWPGRSVEFLPEDQHNSILLGGQLVDTGQIPFVRMYADGGTDRFRVHLTENGGRISRLEIDPWTCAPIVSKEP